MSSPNLLARRRSANSRNSGLNTVNLSELNTFQQFILFFLIIVGSAIFVSAFVVHVRRKAFEIKFKVVVERERQRHQRLRRFSISRPLSRSQTRTIERGTDSKDTREERTLGQDQLQLRNSPWQNESLNREAPTDMPRRRSFEDVEISNTVKKSPSPGHEPPMDVPNTGSCEDVDSSNKVKRSYSQVRESPTDVLEATCKEDSERSDRAKIPPSYGREDPSDITSSRDAHREQSRDPDQDRITFVPGTIYHATTTGTNAHSIYKRTRLLSMQGVGARSTASLPQWQPSPAGKTRSQTLLTDPGSHTDKYFPSSGLIARNSQFYNLDEDERERLGGVEYKAIHFLSIIVPLYFILWQLLGCLGIGAYVSNNRADTARKNGLNPL